MHDRITETFETISQLRWKPSPEADKPYWVMPPCASEMTADFDNITEAISFLSRLNLAEALRPGPSPFIYHSSQYFEFNQNTDDPGLYIHIMPYGADDSLAEHTRYPIAWLEKPCTLSIPAARIDLEKLKATVDVEQRYIAEDQERIAAPSLENVA